MSPTRPSAGSPARGSEGEEHAASRHAADPLLARPAEERLKVHEIYATLQGESTRAGYPCVMVRLTGCQMRCVWCDSEHAFYEGEWTAREEVVARVASFACRMVEVTGGEPLLQPGTLPLLADLADAGHEVLLETGGGLDIGGVDPRVRRILDVKCPGSGEAEANRWENLDLLTGRDEVKLVVASEADYLWARDLLARRPLHEVCPVHLSPVWGAVDPADLAAWILRDRLAARLSLQLHKILWGERRGV